MTFAADLHTWGDRPAVITQNGTLSYRKLAKHVDTLAAQLGPERRLVLVETANDLDSLVGYLAALRGGHVALLAPRSDPDQVTELIATWDPDVVIGADGLDVRRTGSAHGLHPDLALLLATSGSTGSPQLVRPAADALDANAAAIGQYLGIRPDDRAVASLPMHYCYGLSVINSNLRAGAALILTNRSVIDPRFWTTVSELRATSVHGVPYSFELLDQAGFADMDLPHLRYVTQAGGPLAPDQVRRWAQLGRRAGWDLVVMYGQTEATARMAYLPPALAVEHPETIGVAIPGGTLTVENPDEHGVGELVYHGPNVMLGYAEHPRDLALGRTMHELHTGDLGVRRADGLVEIRGRRSRFVKPFGIRVDLDRLERLLAERGLITAVTGTDEHLRVAVETHTKNDVAAAVLAVIEQRLGLPVSMVDVIPVDHLPRRPSGKIDQPSLHRLADQPTEPASSRRPGWRHFVPAWTRTPTVRETRTGPVRPLTTTPASPIL